MSDLIFTSELRADYVEHMGTDLTVVNAARVSFSQNHDVMTEGDEKLIGFLMRNRHASPFEHATVTFMIDAPIFVAREWHRHRTQSYNEVSGRYVELKPKFYVPTALRPMVQEGKPGAYYFTPGDSKQVGNVQDSIVIANRLAWQEYQFLLSQGVAKEVARMCLPVNIYTQWYATANLRNWLNFLSLRAEEHALQEIRDLAFQVEYGLKELFPVTLEAWDKAGRGGV